MVPLESTAPCPPAAASLQEEALKGALAAALEQAGSWFSWCLRKHGGRGGKHGAAPKR